MSLIQYKTVVFGTSRTSLNMVGYCLYNANGTANGSRQESVQNLGGGTYGASVQIPDGFSGRITWDSGESIPVYASEELNLNVRIDMNQPVPLRDLTDVTSQNLGDCLSSTRADSVGALELDVNNKTQTLKGPNGETIRTFTVDDVDRPTRRD